MKYFRPLLFGLCFLTSTLVFAQKIKSTDVPQLVQEASKSAGVPSTSVSWEIEEGLYQAEYDLNGIETTKIFSNAGQFLASETEIKVSALPAAILKFSAVEWQGKKITQASKIEWTNGSIQYEIEIEGHEYILDENGMLLNKDASQDSDGDEEYIDN